MPKPIRLTQPARDRLKTALNKECEIVLPSSLLDTLIDMGEALSLKRGEPLISFGAIDTNVYILIEGIMRIWHYNGDKQVTRAFGDDGSIAISYHSYYMGKPSTECYEACCSCKLLKISKANYEKLIKESHLFARWNVNLDQYQFYRYEVKRHVVNGNAKEKYEALLRHRPKIINNVPLKIIATYLNITPEYLSKLRRTIHD